MVHDRRRRNVMTRRVGSIRVTDRFSVPPPRIFAAWLDAEVAGRWLFTTASRPMTHVEIDPRIAGSFCLADRRNGHISEYRGRYLEIVPPRRLVFDLFLSSVRATTR